MLPQARIDAFAPTRAAIDEFRTDAEESFMRFGVAPETGSVTEVTTAALRGDAEQSPEAESSLSVPLPGVAAALDAAEDGSVYHFRVSGIPVVDRLLRETTGRHPGVLLRSRAYGGTDGYTLYRYDGAAGEFLAVATDGPK